MTKQYTFLDSGNGNKLEQFGEFILQRPCAQAVWQPLLGEEVWKKANAIFTRDSGNKWIHNTKLPESWIVEIGHLRFKIAPTDFGHLGVFPEHSLLWKWMIDCLKKQSTQKNVLNLFAYSGGATLAAASAGAKVCHLDASKGMVSWARENAALNKLESAPIRWIVEDVIKFLGREVKRGVHYDGIILDPPSFGRGNQGEVFKIERDLPIILDLCRKLLSPSPLFLILSSHTPGFTPLIMNHLLKQTMKGVKGTIAEGEMIIPAKSGFDLPLGSYARWGYE